MSQGPFADAFQQMSDSCAKRRAIILAAKEAEAAAAEGKPAPPLPEALRGSKNYHHDAIDIAGSESSS